MPVQAKWLALSLASGAWNADALADRVARASGLEGPAAARLTARLLFFFDRHAPPDLRPLLSFALDEPLLQAVYEREQIRGPLLDRPEMHPAPARPLSFPLPELRGWRDVGLWLCLFDEELAWFADWRDQQRRVSEGKLHHYRYAWAPKRSGGLRLIEKPKSRTKRIQRTILKEILNRVPPHRAAHGFTRGHSIKSFATPHSNQPALLRFDLTAFFHSVPSRRVYALFRCLGYPHTVARLLQGLCSNSVAPELAGPQYRSLSWRDRNRLESRHLPQGAPTSGALANLCAWGLDCRLQGLADAYGYAYSRYADDIAFSGPARLARHAGFLESLVAAIASEEGFQLNHRKTRLRLASQRQRVCGVVVNQKTNVARADWDRLKATLHNCVKFGPESQTLEQRRDFRAHLEGRVAHLAWLNPDRGRKLQQLLARICW